MSENITTGRSVAFTATVNGVPYPIEGKVKNWTAKANVDQVIEKVCGQEGSYIAQEFVGNELTFDLITSDPTIDDLRDALQVANRLGEDLTVNFTRKFTHRSGSRTYMYAECKLQFEESGSRGESVVYKVTATNGTRRKRIG